MNTLFNMKEDRAYCIPFELSERADLSPLEGVLYCAMMNEYDFWIREKGSYMPSHAALMAKCFNPTKPTLLKALNKLEEIGLIECTIKSKGRTPNTYKVNPWKKPEVLTGSSNKEQRSAYVRNDKPEYKAKVEMSKVALEYNSSPF